ncbi:helix-turn-helix transcriptional regulator [Streptomyces sp. NPDC019224]|uniref:helix-turn-helix transcriptional regulator n=1 Tax=Streptomyces sp. NPDC019224 TaxID=3154484 RepID=UPI0033CD395F
MDVTQLAVERAINTMWKRYEEPLSLDNIADSAILSKFYFSRTFRAATGTSPGRFLSAIRLFRAKNLLLKTGMSVTDIAYSVGYNSLGTFTSRFARSVGTSPGRYRLLSQDGLHALGGRPPQPGHRGTITGSIRVPETDKPIRIYVGAFRSPVVEGLPAACAVLDSSGGFTLAHVPRGTWCVHAAAVAMRDLDPRPWLRKPLYLGRGERLTVEPDAMPWTSHIRLRPMSTVDTPILLALPELDNWGAPKLTGVA